MGMFDYVRVSMKCPHCGDFIESSEFQSKDADCKLGLLKQEYVNHYYGDCPKCGKWIEVNKANQDGVEDLRYY